MPVIPAGAAAVIALATATCCNVLQPAATTNNDTLETKLLNYDNQETRLCEQPPRPSPRPLNSRNDDRQDNCITG